MITSDLNTSLQDIRTVQEILGEYADILFEEKEARNRRTKLEGV